jgi:hypothetical protein
VEGTKIMACKKVIKEGVEFFLLKKSPTNHIEGCKTILKYTKVIKKMWIPYYH